MRKLPIGIQDFESIRKDNYLYVDKTAFIYNLVHNGKPYFLSRPRRFGKSLFLSTLRAYWEGRKDLFEGLTIERLEKESEEPWQAHPVFYFDFNRKNFSRETALEEVLISHLEEWEKLYGDEKRNDPLEERFQSLIKKSVEQTGRNAVVLVDEYDKPLLETMTNGDLEEHNKAVFKGFFSTLKSYDHYLKFVFLTGVTKFGKVSVFSDLNQLQDISLNERFAGICGILKSEMEEVFGPELQAFADRQGLTIQECLNRLEREYDGYRFHQDAEGVYNPFSLLNALSSREFGSYWFSTGTPTFLVKRLKEIDYDIKTFTNGSIYSDAAKLSDYQADNPDPVPLLFQTGYLTIRGYDRDFKSYELGYPNDEVKYGFLNSLAPAYLSQDEEKNPNPLDVRSFGIDIKNGNTDGLRDRFTALFARLPRPLDERPVENNFQNAIYIVFMLLGQFVQTEVYNARGRADCIVETGDYVYIFEFKRDGSAREALEQINEKGYAVPYQADERTLYKIGVNFDSETCELNEWKVES